MTFGQLIRCYRDLDLGAAADALGSLKETLQIATPLAIDDAETWDPSYLLQHYARMTDYLLLLDADSSEQDLQDFLETHPEFIYPDYLQCRRKLRLGAEHVTDFAFLVEEAGGPDWVLVEIERSTKNLFTRKGQFSESFSQAKNQLLDWESWILKHGTYLRGSRLPDLRGCYFHLVMGRSHQLSPAHHERLHAEFRGTTRRFSTYDQLLVRYNATLTNLFPAVSPGG